MIKFLRSLFISSLVLMNFSHVAGASFGDVPENAFYKKAIEFLQELGIVNGYEDGTFGPNNEVNRAEMLKILFEAAGIPDAELAPYGNQNCFQDVPAGAWFTKYVCFAKSEGYVDGYADGTFRAESAVNLVEAVKLVLEIFNIEYEQDELVWYRGMVNAASDKNYLPPDVTAFDANLKRGQMADFVTRVLKDQAGEGELADYLGPRSMLKASYETISLAMSDEDWDLDPNNNALVLTTILTSQEDDEKVFTVLDVTTPLADDPSIQNIPKAWMYADAEGSYTYFYHTSAFCILTGDCSETQLEKIDEILVEAEQIAEGFSLGEKEPGAGCYYVSGWDFQTTLPESWGLIHDFTILDSAFWEGTFGYTNTDSFVGQGVVCDGIVDDGGVDDAYVNDNPIRLQAK